MKLKHIHKRAIKNSLFRIIKELDKKIYPLGMNEEVKYIEDLYYALNRKYSKVEIANMLRRIMSYVILTNSPVLRSVPLAKKMVKNITDEEISIILEYIVANNQHISMLYHTLIQTNSEKQSNNHFPFL